MSQHNQQLLKMMFALLDTLNNEAEHLPPSNLTGGIVLQSLSLTLGYLAYTTGLTKDALLNLVSKDFDQAIPLFKGLGLVSQPEKE